MRSPPQSVERGGTEARRKRAEAKLRELGVDVGENGLEEEEKKTKPSS